MIWQHPSSKLCLIHAIIWILSVYRFTTDLRSISCVIDLCSCVHSQTKRTKCQYPIYLRSRDRTLSIMQCIVFYCIDNTTGMIYFLRHVRAGISIRIYKSVDGTILCVTDYVWVDEYDQWIKYLRIILAGISCCNHDQSSSLIWSCCDCNWYQLHYTDTWLVFFNSNGIHGAI